MAQPSRNIKLTITKFYLWSLKRNICDLGGVNQNPRNDSKVGNPKQATARAEMINIKL